MFYNDFLYQQEFSSATSVVVNHNLNSDQIKIRVINTSAGTNQGLVINPSSVVYGGDPLNSFTVNFDSAQTGYVEVTFIEYYQPRMLPPDKVQQLNDADLTQIGSGGSGGITELTSSYITVNNETTDLPNSSRLIAGEGAEIATGPGSIEVSVDDSVVAFQNKTNTFTQANVFQSGLSGSLTTLANGTPYIVGGADISATVQPNGSILIDSTATTQNIEWIEEEFAPQSISSNAAMSQQLQFEPASTQAVHLYVNGILQRQDATQGTYTLGGVGNRGVLWYTNNPSSFNLDNNDCIVFKYPRFI